MEVVDLDFCWDCFGPWCLAIWEAAAVVDMVEVGSEVLAVVGLVGSAVGVQAVAGRVAVGSGRQSVCVRNGPSLWNLNHCFSVFPALKRWAKLVCPSGAGFFKVYDDHL